MSSPLSSLRKSHKTPLMLGKYEREFGSDHGQKQVPFRAPHYSEDEGKLLDEITNHMASHRIKTRDPFTGGLPKLEAPRNTSQFNSPRTSNASSLGRYHDIGIPGNERPPSASYGYDTGTAHINNTFLTEYDAAWIGNDHGQTDDAPNDHELMSSMMNRISLLEQKVSHQNKELNEKNKKIRILEDKVKLLQKARSESDRVDNRANEAEKKCLLLQQKVHEMETFLSDYGMVWVGDKDDPSSNVYIDEDDSSQSSNDDWRPGTSVSNQPEFSVDYDRLLENVKELSMLAGEGLSKIQHTTDGARLKPNDPVQLALYANGMMLFNGPFRPFTDPATQQCIQDFMDGYFPSELQNKFPDGVPFIVRDFRTVTFKEKRTSVFTGAGQVLGGDTKPSRLVPTNLDKETQSVTNHETNDNVTSELPGPQLSMEQFLNKLPKSVVKGGKLIDIRESVGDQLVGGKPSALPVTVVETDTVVDLKKRLDMDEANRPATPRNITTLRVKSDSGNQTYILKMKFHETIADLRKYIDLHRPSGLPPYQIVSAYPNKIYSESSATLEESGLTPNAVLHLRPKKL